MNQIKAIPMLIALYFLYNPASVWAVDGLSNNLINIHSANALEPGTIDVSPTYNIGTARSTTGNTPALLGEHQLDLRVTVGLPRGWEVGVEYMISAPLGLSEAWQGTSVGFGAKWNFWNPLPHKIFMGLLLGFQLPLVGVPAGAEIGLACNFQATPSLLFDLSASVLAPLGDENMTTRVDLGVGWFIYRDNIQLLLEWNHFWRYPQSVALASEGYINTGVNFQPSPAISIMAGAVIALQDMGDAPTTYITISASFILGLR